MLLNHTQCGFCNKMKQLINYCNNNNGHESVKNGNCATIFPQTSCEKSAMLFTFSVHKDMLRTLSWWKWQEIWHATNNFCNVTVSLLLTYRSLSDCHFNHHQRRKKEFCGKFFITFMQTDYETYPYQLEM